MSNAIPAKSATNIIIATGSEPITAQLQTLIDRDLVPLHIVLGPGIHHCGGIRLRSNVTLEIPVGAELHFLPDYDAYAVTTVAIITEESDRAMLVARDAQGIRLCGGGRIYGAGSTHYTHGEDAEMGTLTAHKLRPRVLVMDKCRKVRIEGLRIDDSPMWTLHFASCENVSVSGVAVDNDRRMPNTDGIVIDGCRNVRIEDSSFRTADDGIVLKTTERRDGTLTGPCEGILARNCVVESRSCALKLGTESFSDFRRIRFENIRIEKSNRGLGIFSRDEGKIQDISFSGIVLDCAETPAGFWGSGEAVTLNTVERRPERGPAGMIADVLVEDISGSMEGAVNLIAGKPGDIAGIRLRNISLIQRPGVLGTALRYDIRPTVADRFDLFPVTPGAGRVNAWRFGPDGEIIGLIDYPGGMPGLYASGITELHIDNVKVERPSPLPAAWNAEPVVIRQLD